MMHESQRPPEPHLVSQGLSAGKGQVVSDMSTHPLAAFFNKRVHAQFSHPARVYLGDAHPDHGSVRVEAIDGVLKGLSEEFVTFEVERVFPSQGDVRRQPDETGLQPYVHRCVIVQPTKYLGSVSSQVPA